MKVDLDIMFSSFDLVFNYGDSYNCIIVLVIGLHWCDEPNWVELWFDGKDFMMKYGGVLVSLDYPISHSNCIIL